MHYNIPIKYRTEVPTEMMSGCVEEEYACGDGVLISPSKRTLNYTYRVLLLLSLLHDTSSPLFLLFPPCHSCVSSSVERSGWHTVTLLVTADTRNEGTRWATITRDGMAAITQLSTPLPTYLKSLCETSVTERQQGVPVGPPTCHPPTLYLAGKRQR